MDSSVRNQVHFWQLARFESVLKRNWFKKNFFNCHLWFFWLLEYLYLHAIYFGGGMRFRRTSLRHTLHVLKLCPWAPTQESLKISNNANVGPFAYPVNIWGWDPCRVFFESTPDDFNVQPLLSTLMYSFLKTRFLVRSTRSLSLGGADHRVCVLKKTSVIMQTIKRFKGYYYFFSLPTSKRTKSDCWLVVIGEGRGNWKSRYMISFF